MKPVKTDVKEVEGFKVGNKVSIKSHMVTTMSGDQVESWLSNLEGYICGFASDYDWRTDPNMATLRIYSDKDKATGEYQYAYETSVPVSRLELLEATEGEVVPGKTCPYSRSELREMYVKQQLEKIEKYDFTVQGYRNMATHVAALYLDQDPRFHQQLQSLRRADGTVNPNKVAKAFTQLGLEVDPDALEAPSDFSTIDLGYYRNLKEAIRKHQAIDWNEVAEDFAA